MLNMIAFMRKHYTLRLFMSSILLTLSSANFAFDNQGFAQTQAMPAFTLRFGDRQANGSYVLPATFLSYSNAFPFILLICGIVIGSMISDRFGRRMTVFVMSVWAMCCVPIVVTSTTTGQFLAGRCLNSVYIGMEMSVIPVFQSEIVPAATRGLATASYQMSFAVGGLIISGICHYTSTFTTDWAWKIPFLCYLFVPSIVGGLIWLQPESPRWLASKGKVEEARAVLRKFRTYPDIEHELSQMLLSIELERNTSKGTYAACFRGSNLRRTLIVFAVNFFLQSTGQAFGSLYGVLIVASLGTINPFNFTLISGALGFVVVALGMFLNDKLGRRSLLLASAGMQAVSLWIIAGLGTHQNESIAINNALVTFIVLFGLAFSFGWAPLAYTISAETPSQTLRDKTARMGFSVGIVTQFVVAFTLPYLLYAPYANLGMKVGFIYAPFATLALIWAYFCLPECKGLSLDQVDLLFEDGISARASTKWGNEHKLLDITADESGHMTTAMATEKAVMPLALKEEHESVEEDVVKV